MKKIFFIGKSGKEIGVRITITVILVWVAIKTTMFIALQLETKTLTFNGEPIVNYGVVLQTFYQENERVFFSAQTNDKNNLYVSLPLEQLKNNTIECEQYEQEKTEQLSFQEITVDGIDYFIMRISPSGKCMVLTPKGQNGDSFYFYNIAENKIIGQFEPYNEKYEINYDDTKVIYSQKCQETISTRKWQVLITDFETKTNKRILATDDIDEKTFRWINNEEVTFQGWKPRNYWVTMYAYKYSLKTDTLKILSNFYMAGNDGKEPNKENIFWSPDGKKVFYLVEGTSKMRRWK